MNNNKHTCESCSYHPPITRCFSCNILTCACCIVEGGICCRCLNNDNSIEACNDFIRNRTLKTRFFKVDLNTGYIIPIKKRRFCCFYIF